MHGLWYERTWLDLGREAIIHAVLSLLYVPAYKIKCFTSMAIVTVIGLQHLASLFIHPDGFLTNAEILPGAAALAILAYWKESWLLFFVGSYSIISKYNYLRMWTSVEFRESLGSIEDTCNELSKFFVALGVFALFRLWLPARKIKSFLKIPPLGPSSSYLPDPKGKIRPALPRWFSEFIVPYELFMYYSRGMRGFTRIFGNEKDEVLSE